MRYVLSCHPNTPAPAVAGIEVSAHLSRDGGLVLGYTLSADLARLRIPPATIPGRADGLWRHTCFEAFVRSDESSAYREFNFSPSGRWQAYGFSAYREGCPLETIPPPDLERRESAAQLTLTCRVPAQALPAGERLRMAVSAVVEAADASLAYWALRHPAGKPDFHHAHGFTASIERPESTQNGATLPSFVPESR